jgi:hypothetical protein
MRVLRLLPCVLRFSSLSILIASLLICASLSAQQISQPTSASKDAQALTILNQALTSAGGIPAVSGVTDYKGSGALTFHQSADVAVQGSVTVNGKGFYQFRMDENFPTGVRSWSLNQGITSRKNENGQVSQYPPKSALPSSDASPYQVPMSMANLVFPYLHFLSAVTDSNFALKYQGLVQLNGRSVHDVQVQQTAPGAMGKDPFFVEYHTMDLFIDPSNFQIVLVQDKIPNHIVHQVFYSDYRLVGSVVIPFAISEQMGGQKTWDVQLNQINLNTGLQDSDFDLQ